MLPDSIYDFEYIITWIYDFNKIEAYFLIYDLNLYELKLDTNGEYIFISYINKDKKSYLPSNSKTYSYLEYKYLTEDITFYLMKNRTEPLGDILKAQDIIKNRYLSKVRKEKIDKLLK